MLTTKHKPHGPMRGGYFRRNRKDVFMRAGDMLAEMLNKQLGGANGRERMFIAIIAQAVNDYMSPDKDTTEQDTVDACYFIFVDTYMFDLLDVIGIDGSYVRRLIDEMDS